MSIERPVRAAGHDRRVAQHPGPDRGGQRGQPASVQAGRSSAILWGMAAELSAFGERQVVQALGVGPQLGRGAGQRLRHTRSEGLLERGQRPVADPGPGEPEVLVVRVLPGLEAQLGAGGGGGAAAHGQQRPAVPAAPVVVKTAAWR